MTPERLAEIRARAEKYEDQPLHRSQPAWTYEHAATALKDRADLLAAYEALEAERDKLRAYNRSFRPLIDKIEECWARLARLRRVVEPTASLMAPMGDNESMGDYVGRRAICMDEIKAALSALESGDRE